ncbi:3-oxoacyl-[acyl-carrier-protein] synthase III C-terminal domain-containing protein [Lacibacter sediminis]|uniref:Ketoacyl-ACP synthase III n=1 Tax=Lacibacter sediminis TaxID=2760713 RepID=A0A7G5XET4_9BACT|nr:3-oxoacyl-[acyl-carrier-protein] synthase III C-terminal domain-containing protein [Lacibacter sediminis]QNA43987.1 hypothetical protein H4075_18215 [Lacibacter sediminis]
MLKGKPVRIVGFGEYLPRKVLSSEIEEQFGLYTGWSEKYSGVATRHHVTFETNAYMGARAVEQALANCSVPLSEIDLLISAAATYDYPIPNEASVIKSQLKDGNQFTFPTIDIDSTCLSFVSAFEIAANLLDGKQYKKIIIVSSEVSSKGLNPENSETVTLFGDAAVAVIVQYDEDGNSLFIKGGLQTYSEGVMDAIIEGGGTKYSFKDHAYNQKLHSFAMNGKNLLRLAKKCIPHFMDFFFRDLPISILDTDAIIPHQASKAGLMMFKSLYPFRDNQVKDSLCSLGNCIAASIPLTFYRSIKAGEIKRGDVCLLSGTSAGFSIGGVLIKY